MNKYSYITKTLKKNLTVIYFTVLRRISSPFFITHGSFENKKDPCTRFLNVSTTTQSWFDERLILHKHSTVTSILDREIP